MGLPPSCLVWTPEASQIAWFVPPRAKRCITALPRQNWGLAAIAHRGTKGASCDRLRWDGQGLDLGNLSNLTGLRHSQWDPCAVYHGLIMFNIVIVLCSFRSIWPAISELHCRSAESLALMAINRNSIAGASQTQQIPHSNQLYKLIQIICLGRTMSICWATMHFLGHMGHWQLAHQQNANLLPTRLWWSIWLPSGRSGGADLGGPGGTLSAPKGNLQQHL